MIKLDINSDADMFSVFKRCSKRWPGHVAYNILCKVTAYIPKKIGPGMIVDCDNPRDFRFNYWTVPPPKPWSCE
jgi:hypothetical protein